MNSKPSWLWNAFFFVYIFVAFNATVSFFDPTSQVQNYYQILISFSSLFLISYSLNVLAVIFDIIAILPFYNFIKPNMSVVLKKYFSPGIWKWFFSIRAILLIVGHSYDYKQIQSISHENMIVILLVALSMTILYLPSYITTFIIAYRQDK